MKRIIAVLAAVVMMAAIPAATAENIVMICDEADLLSIEEEAELYQAMAPVCAYGTPVFWTTEDEDSRDAEAKAAAFLKDTGRTEDGVIFVIDLAKRQVVISAAGNTSRDVTPAIISLILDNTYQLATDGDYAGCAETSYAGILAALEGRDVDTATKQPEDNPAIPAPMPALQADGDTVLYYNPDGGRLYHLDQNCISVHSKYLPLPGSFSYSQVNEAPYAELEPCQVCGAPLRQK